MDKLVDLIWVREKELEDEICSYLIDFFEKREDLHEKFENDRKPNFTQINLTEVSEENEEISQVHTHILKKIISLKHEYYNFIDERCFPQKNAYEQIRIKRYLPNQNEAFDTHVDVVDHETSRRYLSYLWYLNDVEEGGETSFKDLVIRPETGKLVMFPPLWMYPHKGSEPTSNPKYILTSYLHYTDGQS
jgi:hypothetical protein